MFKRDTDTSEDVPKADVRPQPAPEAEAPVAAQEAPAAEEAPAALAPPAAPAPPGPAGPVELWAARHRVHPSKMIAARLVHGWPEGHRMTAGAFTAAVGAVVDTPASTTGARRIEAHLAATELHPWQFAAARAFHSWPIGLEMTEAEFKTAVKAATDNVVIR